MVCIELTINGLVTVHTNKCELSLEHVYEHTFVSSKILPKSPTISFDKGVGHAVIFPHNCNVFMQ